MAKKILSTFDTATILEVLCSEAPDLIINSINIIETGWDHLVADVNGDWIFRFPRTQGSIANLQREKNLLDHLKAHISLPIPHFHYLGAKTAFAGYRKIQGIHLNQHIYAGLDDAVRHRLAKTLATFFTQMHAVNKDQALQWGFTTIIRPLFEIESKLLGTLPKEIGTMVKQAVDYARIDLSKAEDQVFLHQDVNGDNLAFDIATAQITGVFDFSDTGIGPRSWDFAELFNVDAQLAQLTADIYAKMNNVPSPLMGGAVDYILRKATLMLGHNDYSLDEKKLLKGLEDFLPIWRVVSLASSVSR